MRTNFLPGSLILLSLASACTDEASDPGALEFRTTFTCQGCGINGNSPRVNGYDVPELNLDQAPNDDGVKLLGIVDPGKALYPLDIINDEFVAQVGPDPNQWVKGWDLIGWSLRVELPKGDIHDLTIFAYEDDIASWASGADTITAYAIAYLDPGTGDFVHVCPSSGTNQYDVAVTVIDGETYDREDITVNPNMIKWFTLACAGNAVAKMKLMNYGPNDDFDGQGNPATVAQRQATLKMITADYCGDGTSYTAQGTEVHWQNASRTVDTYPVSPDPRPDTEAYWTEDGALCLDTPRLASVDHGQIGCVLPSCDEIGSGDAEWITWKPVAP